MKKTGNKVTGRNIIGPNLRRIRLAQKVVVTLEDMAGRLAKQGIEIDRSAIGRIENQTRYVLDYEAKALAVALKTDIRDLFAPLKEPGSKPHEQ